NPAIHIGKTILYWKQWHSIGIHTVGDLYKYGVFMSYGNLMEQYGLKGKDHFWRYLQIRDCVMSTYKNVNNVFLGTLNCRGNAILLHFFTNQQVTLLAVTLQM
ncbi:hypothetical protein LDENG_00082750, partial [Lucifuga dentata]